MAQKMPWWHSATATTKPRLIIWSGSLFLISGLGNLVLGIVDGKALNAVLGGIFLLCGLPWYIPAAVLVRRNHIRAASEQTRPSTSDS